MCRIYYIFLFHCPSLPDLSVQGKLTTKVSNFFFFCGKEHSPFKAGPVRPRMLFLCCGIRTGCTEVFRTTIFWTDEKRQLCMFSLHIYVPNTLKSVVRNVGCPFSSVFLYFSVLFLLRYSIHMKTIGSISKKKYFLTKMNQKLVFSKKKKIYIASFGPCVNVLYVDVHHTDTQLWTSALFVQFCSRGRSYFFSDSAQFFRRKFSRKKVHSKGHPTFNHTISLISAAERRPKNTHMHKSENITAHLPFFIFEKKKSLPKFFKNFPFSVHAKPSIALWVFLILSLAGNYNELAAYKGSMLLFRTIPISWTMFCSRPFVLIHWTTIG